MRRSWRSMLLVGLVLATLAELAAADEGKDLPEGPIRERHELMEGIGKNAKKIGEAMKAGGLAGVPEAADAIKAAAARIPGLFPEGSTDPKSRAKPEIWKDWADFKRLSTELEESAGAMAVAARTGLDVEAASQSLFQRCKSCHDRFRVPEK